MPPGGDEKAEGALEGVGESAVELGGLDLELLGRSISALIIATIAGLQPVHRAGREGEIALEPDLDAG